MLAITGTNGKTTVTALDRRAVPRGRARRTVVAGNIGDAGARRARRRTSRRHAWPDVFVLELSSFQLETTCEPAAAAATVLNVTDNHLDRYAGIDDYAAAKARIFAHGGVQVLNRDDPRSCAMRIPGRTVDVRRGVPAGEGEWGLVRSTATHVARARRRAAGAGRRLALAGLHNALNALAALALVSAVGAHRRAHVLDALRAFKGLPHRMERVAETGGVAATSTTRRAPRRRDAGGARRHRAAGGADRGRRRQGPGFRAAQARGRRATAARWC